MSKMSLEELRHETRELLGTSGPIARSSNSWAVPVRPSLLDGSTLLAGSTVELLGYPESWLMQLFSAHPETRVAWIEARLTLFPTAITQKGVDLSRFLFVETEDEWDWSLSQILRSKLFSFVVLRDHDFPEIKQNSFLRKLQIQVERSGSVLFLLSSQSTSSFCVTHRYYIGPESKNEFRVLKEKRG